MESTTKLFGVTTDRNTTLPTGVYLEVFDEEDESEVDWRFHELVESLMWPSNQTIPDISHAVRAVARYVHAPKLKHWQAARGVLEHIKVTNSYGNTFQIERGLEMVVYADVADGPKATQRKSVSDGIVICGGKAIQWIQWTSRRQNCTTLSSSEAEVAMACNGRRS